MAGFLDMRGRTFLVTGASSGIGRETCITLARLGARVVLSGRNEVNLLATKEQMGGSEHLIAPVDLASADLPVFFKNLTRQSGQLDGVVHCAGLHIVRPLKLVTAEKSKELFDVNVFAALQLTKAFRLRQVRAEPYASVVLLSSAVGMVGQSGVSVYSATKGAILALTKSLAIELAPEGIRVNCISPGVVDTEMTTGLRQMLGENEFAAVERMHPLGIGKSSDVAPAVCFLLSDGARWITGANFVVDGGYTAH